MTSSIQNPLSNDNDAAVHADIANAYEYQLNVNETGHTAPMTTFETPKPRSQSTASGQTDDRRDPVHNHDDDFASNNVISSESMFVNCTQIQPNIQQATISYIQPTRQDTNFSESERVANALGDRLDQLELAQGETRSHGRANTLDRDDSACESSSNDGTITPPLPSLSPADSVTDCGSRNTNDVTTTEHGHALGLLQVPGVYELPFDDVMTHNDEGTTKYAATGHQDVQVQDDETNANGAAAKLPATEGDVMKRSPRLKRSAHGSSSSSERFDASHRARLVRGERRKSRGRNGSFAATKYGNRKFADSDDAESTCSSSFAQVSSAAMSLASSDVNNVTAASHLQVKNWDHFNTNVSNNSCKYEALSVCLISTDHRMKLIKLIC